MGALKEGYSRDGVDAELYTFGKNRFVSLLTLVRVDLWLSLMVFSSHPFHFIYSITQKPAQSFPFHMHIFIGCGADC